MREINNRYQIRSIHSLLILTVLLFPSSVATLGHTWTACLLFEDVGDEETDHLAPSHFGKTNDSKINRKQRHRKQCETRDDGGVSIRARECDDHTQAHVRQTRLYAGVSIHLIKAVQSADSKRYDSSAICKVWCSQSDQKREVSSGPN